MLIKRVITGVLGILLTIYVVTVGGWLFGGAILLLALAAWYEFCRAFSHMNLHLCKWLGSTAIILIISSMWLGNESEVLAIIMLTVLVVLAKSVFNHNTFSINEACISVCGIFYIGLAFGHIILLRFIAGNEIILTPNGFIPIGCAFIWLAFIGTWASDTFAFFVGTKFGKHKLCPAISPGKSREGFVGGIVGTAICLAGLGYLFALSLVHMIILGILVALIATLGDLVESSFKRWTGIKDSGQILPGHGGVLDRFDSLLFTVPLVYYYVQIFSLY